MFKSDMKKEFGVSGITSGSMQAAINNWMNIYRGNPEWIDKDNRIRSIKFAKAVCSETARLTTLALDVCFDGSRSEYMQKFWDKQIKRRLRNWVEYGCAAGTVILKPNGSGVDFVTPDRYEIVNKDGDGNITGIVFQDHYQADDTFYTKLEYHRFWNASLPDEPNQATPKVITYYRISNRTYSSPSEGEIGKPCEIGATKWANLLPDAYITKNNDEKLDSMLFGVFRMPAANDIDLDSPLGMAVFSDAIEELKDLDIAYSRNAGEIFDSESIELLDDRLLSAPGTKIGSAGNGGLPHHVRNVYGAGTEEFYQAIERPLETEKRIKGINQQLSFIGYKCGYSNGYFVFDQKTGMVTATQVESDDRRTIQLIKDIRDELQACMDGLFYAQAVFADLYHMAPVGDYEANYSFGDITYSYEEDKQHHYNLAMQGKYPWEEYYVEYLKYSRKEAKRLIKMAQEENKKPELFGDDNEE